MTTLADWHARITDRPDDLPLRLVFADWLQQQGDAEFGEFITLECRILLEPGHADARRWRRRANLLRKAHEQTWWFASYPPFANMSPSQPRYDLPARPVLTVRGGMIEAAKGMYADLEALGGHAPALTSIEIVDTYHRFSPVPALAPGASPIWPQLHSVVVHAVGRFVDILAVRPLPRLRRLRVRHAREHTARLLDELERHAPNLARLELPEAESEPSTLAKLATWTRPLVALDLYRNHLSADVVAALASGPLFSDLRELMLGRTDLGPAGLAALAHGPHIARLERLDVRAAFPGAGPSATSLALLAQRATSLTSLELMSSRLRDTDAPALLSPGAFPALRELSLQGCSLGDATVQHLLSSPLSTQLVALNLRANKLTSASARALSVASLPALRLLNLEGNAFDADALALLRDTPNLAHATITAGSMKDVDIYDSTNAKAGIWLSSTCFSKPALRQPPAS